jgi:uncharacterized protein
MRHPWHTFQNSEATMISKIFVNLAVKDLDKSMAFFKAVGFSFNPKFTDATAACMVMNEHIYAMLLTHPKMKQFTDKDIADAHKTAEVLVCLAVENKAQVDDIAGKAVKAGAKEPRPMQDYGFMIQRSFEDLDGHIWEVVWMDPTHVQK